VSLGSPPLKSVILSFVTSCSLIFKIVQTQTFTVIITQTKKPHHLPRQNRLFQPEAKPNCASTLQGIQPKLCRLRGNASKTTYDVTKLFTRHGEQSGCFKSAWLHWRFLSLFIYLNSSVTEQPAVMLKQTSKNRSTVLKNISAGWETVQIKAVFVINR